MKIAVFGIGGVGGYFGGRLVEAGADVVFIARGEHLKAIKENGLRVNSDRGEFVVMPSLATDKPAEAGEVDVVLVATKSWQIPEAIKAMRPMIGEDTFIVPLLNGVDAPAQLAKAFGKERVLGGLCRLVAWIEAPRQIKQFGLEPFIAFGEFDKKKSDRAQKLYNILNSAAHVTVEVSEDIEAEMWQKILLIAPWSGVGAVTRAPMGVIRDVPQSRQMLIDAMQEIFDVARAHKINLPDYAVNKTLTFIDGLPHDSTASMQRDVMEGRPSELESQNGAIVRLGAEVKVPTPTHAFIYHSLLPAELKARGELK